MTETIWELQQKLDDARAAIKADVDEKAKLHAEIIMLRSALDAIHAESSFPEEEFEVIETIKGIAGRALADDKPNVRGVADGRSSEPKLNPYSDDE